MGCASCDRGEIVTWPPPAATSQSQVPFKAGVVLVPVDVRVVDAHGSPITDLTATDFTVHENGERKDIAHFSTQSSIGAVPGAVALTVRAPRSFFILLGNGRLNEPVKALDAIIEFVRTSLLPGDRVAVLAFLHLAEFTTDREAVARLLERFRARHEAIDAKLSRDRSRGPGAPVWPLAPDTLTDIAALFDAPDLPRVQRFPGGAGGKGSNFSDHTYLRLVIDYLRHVEGEKHVVFLAEQALAQADSYAKSAAAARATVSLIQTGGARPFAPSSGRFGGGMAMSLNGPDAVGARSARTLAEETGGVTELYSDVRSSLTRLLRTTNFQYLLGFYPDMPLPDGQYRELRVTVKRRGATVLYRHGFEAQPRPVHPMELRHVFAESSILAALPLSQSLARIPMELSARTTRGPGDAVLVNVDVVIDPESVTVMQAGDRYTTCIDVAAFVRNAGEKVLGEQWGRIDLVLDSGAYGRLQRDRIRYAAEFHVTGRPTHVKFLVYEYDAARVAHSTVRLR